MSIDNSSWVNKRMLTFGACKTLLGLGTVVSGIKTYFSGSYLVDNAGEVDHSGAAEATGYFLQGGGVSALLTGSYFTLSGLKDMALSFCNRRVTVQSKDRVLEDRFEEESVESSSESVASREFLDADLEEFDQQPVIERRDVGTQTKRVREIQPYKRVDYREKERRSWTPTTYTGYGYDSDPYDSDSSPMLFGGGIEQIGDVFLKALSHGRYDD